MLQEQPKDTVKSATIEIVSEVFPHPNADKMDLAKVNGWIVCIKKGEYKAGDICIYVQTDTVLKDCPQYEFLRKRDFRIRPMKLRGVLSQGILFPISLLQEFGSSTVILDEKITGTDVSNIIGASHYEKPVPACLSGEAKGYLPSFIRKTDEENIENVLDVLNELKGKPYYITIKIDGSSGTFYRHNKDFGVCSRNLHLKPSSNNGFWKMVEKYNIDEKLSTFFPDKNRCIQGEVYGPGIQGNKLGVDEIKLAVFNLWDTDNRCYCSYDELKQFCNEVNIPMVKVIDEGESFNMTFENLQSLADSLKYENGHIVEGIVLRPKVSFISKVMEKPLSVKIINTEFKLKYV
jgi:RNA ligase (TIGR02306 family)